MQILLVVTKGDLGGAQKRVLNLATRLQDRGDDVTVGIGGFGDWLPAQLRAEGINFTRFPNLSRLNPFKIIGWLFSFYRFLQDNDFDVVHLNSSSALAGTLPAYFAHVPSVFTFRGLSIISPNYPAIAPLKAFYWLAFRVLIPFLDVGVFQCEHDRSVASGRGLMPSNSVVVRPGIDPDSIGYRGRHEACKRLQDMLDTDLANTKLIGSIGRLSPQKNYGFLLNAFKEVYDTHEDARLVLIGDGELREKLETKAEALEIDPVVHFAGEVTGAARLMKAFDVFVLPSLYEGVSMTLTEAVHAGVPVLASDVGGNRETVCDNKSALFSFEQDGQLANKINKLLADKQARKKATATAGCQKSLLLENSVDNYCKLYESISSNS
jgi:glycosyltransferase involved in cell wall biosynthesis